MFTYTTDALLLWTRNGRGHLMVPIALGTIGRRWQCINSTCIHTWGKKPLLGLPSHEFVFVAERNVCHSLPNNPDHNPTFTLAWTQHAYTIYIGHFNNILGNRHTNPTSMLLRWRTLSSPLAWTQYWPTSMPLRWRTLSSPLAWTQYWQIERSHHTIQTPYSIHSSPTWA